MKTINILLLVFLFAALNAETPKYLKFQAVAKDAEGALVTSQNISVRISILSGSATGSSVYTEIHSVTTSPGGIAEFEIGNGTASIGTFSNIDWSSGSFFCKVELDLKGGNDYTHISTSQFLSVPYALYADKAGNGFNADGIDSIILKAPDGKKFILKVDTSGNLIVSKINSPVIPVNSVTDADGNVYATVTIGTQLWMKENLKTTKYNDGSNIPLVTDNTAWSNLTSPAYCWYNNDVSTYKATYGALYNWYVVNTGKLCPTGWHVPTDAEWHTLVLYLDPNAINAAEIESLIAGGKLKETGTTHWSSPNTGADNSSGFTALPGGFRDYNSTFDYVGIYGDWWSSSEYDTYDAWYRGMINEHSNVGRFNYVKFVGFSVRCLRDN